MRPEEDKVKQGSHHGEKKLFEPITKTVNKTSEKLLEDSKARAAPIKNVVKNFFGPSNALFNKQEFFNFL